DGLRHALVPEVQKADHAIRTDEGNADPRLLGVEVGTELSKELGLLDELDAEGIVLGQLGGLAARAQELPYLVDPPLDVLAQDRLLPGPGDGEKTARRARVQEGNGGGAAAVDEGEAGARIGQKVDGAVGDAARLVEGVQADARHVQRVDDAGQADLEGG